VAHPRERRVPRRIDRRQFLRYSAGAAAAFPTAAALLAACGHASNPDVGVLPPTGGSGPSGSPSELPFPLARPDNPVTWPIYDDNPPIDSGLSPESNATLKVYNWEDYLWPRLLKNFCAEMGCKYELTTFEGVDEALAKIRTGQVDFDLYFPDPSLIGKLVSAKLVRPLNLDYIPNLKNVWPNLQSPFYDVGSRYTVPYVIYTTGVAWRNDKVPDDIPGMANPYEIFWDSKYKGKIHIFNDYRESIGMALLKNGITDLNTEDPSKIDIAKTDLLKTIDVANVKLDIDDWTDLPEGVSWIHQAWSGDIVSAQYYLPKGVPVEVLQYWSPPDGRGAIGSDNITVLKSGKNPVLAHMFINYLLDNKNGFDNFYNLTGYQPPFNTIHPDTLVSDGVIPASLETTVVSPDDFDKGFTYLELSPSGDALWHSAYQQFEAGAT
jgi:spermidine/putrescine transport system substrate-binding protein